MLNIASSFLPDTSPGDYRAHLAEVTKADNNYAPLVSVDFGQTETLIVEASDDEITLPENWETVSAIASNGKTFTPATNPESPQIGEFIYNPYTNTVRVYYIGDVRSFQIFGTPQEIKFSPPLLPPPYPQLFTNLPLTGAIQFTRQFEQQPSAQFELEMTLSKGQIQNIFAPGTELDLYGLPLRINSISITELQRSIYPDSRCKVSVSLGSRWENYLDSPCFLRSDGKNIILNNLPFQDPDCASGSYNEITNPNLSTTIQDLLSRIGIAYSGPSLAIVPIPLGTARDTVVNPLQLLSDRLLLANSFVRWSNAEFVEVVPINSTRVWNYQESDILEEVETSYEAISKTSKKRLTSIPNYNQPLPDLVNFPSVVQQQPIPQLRNESPVALAFEYPNSELIGDFTQTQFQINNEQTQGRSPSRYVRMPSKREVRVDGNKNAHIPLAGVEWVENMSLIFDIGGQTETRSTTTTEDGAIVQVVDEIWGFAATAYQMYDELTFDPESLEPIRRVRGNPNDVWQCIKKTTTDYFYDLATGYLLSTSTTGYNTVRYKQESADEPETLSLQVLPSDQTPGDNEPTTDPEYFLYLFIRIPVIGRSKNFLELMPDFGGVGEADLIKVCNRDGTSSFKINPNYAPPYYVKSELTESTAFASIDNPKNQEITAEGGIGGDPEGSDFVAEKYLPRLIVGEESNYSFDIQTTEPIYQQALVGFFEGIPIYQDGAEISPQKATKYIKEFSAQGPQMSSAVEQISIEESTSELPTATRKPNLYTEQQPAPNTTQQPIPHPKYRYFLRTAGYGEADPIIGSENFTVDGVAITFEQAITAAICKAAIENGRNGFTETLQIDGNLLIKEGDRFNYICNGEYRQRVVLGVQTTLNILGVVAGVPKITAVTSLTLGRWVLPEIEYSQIPIIKIDSTLTFAVSQTLGSTIDWTTVRSRRNP